MTELSEDQLNDIKALFNKKEWKTGFKYGSRDNDIKPCIRLINPEKEFNNPISDLYGGWTLNCYEAAYIKQHKRIPTDKLSHQCDSVYKKRRKKHIVDPKERKKLMSTNCVEGTHIICEPYTNNRARDTCHNKIRKWEKRNRWCFNKINGPLKLSTIQRKEDEKNHITVRRRALLNRNGNHGYYWCTHDDTCFINYGQLELSSADEKESDDED